MMLHTKFKGSRSYGFRHEDFYMFSLLILCKKCVSLDGAFFSPQGHNLNKLGKGPPVDATYQISKL